MTDTETRPEDTPSPDNPPWRSPLRPSRLARRVETSFDIAPDAETRDRIAGWAGIDALNGLRMHGSLTPDGPYDWRLEAEFEAEVVQPCVVTLAPVTTRLAEPVLRRYVAELPEPEGDEVEMPEDTSVERLPPVIDLAQVALETLELALPLYPRAEGAELSLPEGDSPEIEAGEPAHHPFAALRGLLDPGADDGTEGGKKG